MSDLGDVILTRELARYGKKVLVQVGRPVPFASGKSDCYVPFRIDGLDDEAQVLSAAGIDGVQALLLALGMIGDRLRIEQGLTFLDSTELGFPATAPEGGRYVAIYRG